MSSPSVNPLIKDIDRLGGDEALDWTCAECGETFQTERAFKLHQKHDHDLNDPFI